MIKAYKYKLKPTKEQQELLSTFFGATRFIYNWGLDRRIKLYEESKQSLTFKQQSKELTKLKQQEGFEWLKETPAVSLQQSLRNLDAAYKNFFGKKQCYPKFKSRKKAKDSVKFIESVTFDFINWSVKLPKIGKVKLCKNRPFNENHNYTYKQGTTTVSKDKCGEYWCTVVISIDKPLPQKTNVDKSTAVGVDLGIKDYAILSNGDKVPNPKYYEKHQCKLAKLQKDFSKKTKDSKNRERARLKVAKEYRKITNLRIDFLHKLTTYLVQTYDTICIEDLNVEGMVKNHHLAKSIQSCSWGEFVRLLTYKCEWYGKNLIVIDRFAPSSKTCHECGHINKDLTLSDRVWICPHCGSVLDRDVNAARNILEFAFIEKLK